MMRPLTSVALALALLGLASVALGQTNGKTATNGAKAVDDLDASVEVVLENALEYQLVEYPAKGNTGLPDGFVTVDGNKFRIGGCDFVFAGFNIWQAAEMASNDKVNRGGFLPPREHLTNIMDEAVLAGLKVMRIWAHTIKPERALQPEPGVYDEEIFQGLDFINAEAGKRGLRIVWAFADNWYETNGVPGYEKWAGGDFFGPTGRQLYKDNIAAIVNRENTITGIKYKDDPAIMSWNLANELRCKKCPSSKMQSWIEEMCGFLKGQGIKQLVSIGYEGFYGPDDPLKVNNPAEWADQEGQDFVKNNQVGCIDYVGIHVWPDNWNFVDTEFQQNFIRGAVEATDSVIGKPLVLEEFGKIEPNRDEFYVSAYDVVEESVNNGTSLRGTIFYHWYDQGIGPGSYGVWSDSSTFQKIKANAAFMNEQSDC